MKKKWTLSGIARREFLNHRHWLLAICVNTIWLPPNWNIHTSEQMAPFALLPFLVPYTLSSCLWVCRHLMCGVMCERRCISWPWQCMQTFFTIHAKHRLPTPSERGEQEFHTVLFKLAAFRQRQHCLAFILAFHLQVISTLLLICQSLLDFY